MFRPFHRLLALALVCALTPTTMALAKGKDRKTPTPDTVSSAGPSPALDPALLGSLEWREVGPYRGGRSAAVTGLADQRQVYYFGSTGGGVWKTRDGGTSWQNISDGFFGGSIGAVAVAPSDPNVIYVGGGEQTVRGNVSPGDGVWKSTDAGKTWSHVGLTDSHHVPRIRIDPRDPERVYVAALGHLFGSSEERGVFRSLDGGASWQKVLFVNADSGAIDLVIDPTNPRILYAAFWRVRRTPWSLESGGEGSGLWRSTDGGTTWKELSTNPGLPAPPLGIAGITVSPSNPDNLYAIVEAEDGGVFRSRDGGATWQRANEQRDLRQRAWYYTRIVADPLDEESVYVLNVRFHRSKDGGKTFSEISTPHGDNHDLWIDPGDPQRMIEANDGGANISFDGGATWSTQDNQPTAQMYRVSTDSAFPYRLLGGQQDNSALRIRSRSALGGAIGARDWEPTAGGESGHVVAKPDDPDIVIGGSYGGFLTLLNHRTGEQRALNVWPDDPMGWGAAELAHRFQWNFPVLFSPHDPDLLYAAANRLFASRDLGVTWTTISPDLTRDDKSKMGPSGGPITKDNTSVEYYGTIFAVAESPLVPGLLWTGSDDGLVQLSRDGGGHWQNVTPPDLPEWAQINSIEPHPGVPGGLYLAATRYKLDDFTPYLFATTDYGVSWRRIDQGIDRQHFTRVIRADPDRPGLLYAGTERGIYVSFDDGARWQSLQLGLPKVPVTDLAVKEGNLVAATQGRGYWILDDLAPLHQLSADLAEQPLHLFTPAPTLRLDGGRSDKPGNRGTNPPDGTVLHFWLADEPAADTEATLEIIDPEGRIAQRFTRKKDDGGAEQEDGEKGEKEARVSEDPRQLAIAKGMNRFVWNLRYPAAESFPGMVLWNDRLDGPRAIPGTYTAKLRIGEVTAETNFEIAADPRSSASQSDLRTQLGFLLAVRDKLTETHRALTRLRDVKEQLKALEKRLADDNTTGSGAAESGAARVRQASEALRDKLETIEKNLYQTQNRSPQDPLNFPVRLNDKLAGLMGLAGYGDSAPSTSMVAVSEQLGRAIDTDLAALETLWRDDLAALEALIAEHHIPAIGLGKPADEVAVGEAGDR